MVEHAGKHARRLRPPEASQPLHNGADPQGAVVDLRRLVDLLGPEQGHRLGQIADEVAAHVEQHGINPLFGDRPDLRGLDGRQVELAGQRRQRIAAVRIGRAPEIVADQLELGVARPCIDQGIEQL
jgi:hypothetical protein